MNLENPLENKSSLFIGGGVLAALTASLCCVGPLILTILGVSGAAALAQLEFLRVPMIIIVVFLFGVAGFNLFRKRKICEPGSICADPKKYKRIVFAYWAGLTLSFIGITSPYWLVWLF